MSSLPPAPQDAHADVVPDPAVARAERRLALLAELAEIGMELARALTPSPPSNGVEAPEADATAARRVDPAQAFAGLSRAVRLTLMLEERADQALCDLKAGVVRMREEKRARTGDEARAAAAEARQEREGRIHDLVLEAAEGQIKTAPEFERLDRELEERLLLDEAWWSDPARPLRAIVERLCDHFDLTPDWSRWEGDRWTPARPPAWPWSARSEAPPAPPPPGASRDHELPRAHDLE